MINMAMTRRPKRQYSCEIVNLEEMVPQDHFLRVIEKYFDWNFFYDEVEKLYSKYGRKSIDPVILIKIHILKFLFHEDSLRRTYENLKYNILYRWFIGYNLCEDIPDHSTHTKAYANKKKNHKEIIKVEAKKYQKELDLEIALKGLHEEDLTEEEYFEEVERIIKCNEEIDIEEVLGEKEVIVSDTDKDAGMLYKSDKEKMFGYNTSIICENQNYVLTVDTNGSNVHDSVSFYQSSDNLLNHFDVSKIDYFVGDAAYITPHICKTIIELGMIPVLPYTRKGYRKDYFKKYEFVYDEYNNIYICPNEKDLIPTGINKDGYIIYKADQHDCSNCPFKEHCTKGKYKQVLRHVWEGYKEMANEYRQEIKVKEIYKQRSQHIERIFADGKMKYGLRYTYFRGKERVHRELTLLYACMNLKKFALHHYV